MAERLRQYVWDVPTRLFHWLLVALIGFSWWSAETYHMDWHQWSGIAVFGLLIFRLIWGVIGTETARFGRFVAGPRGVWTYVRGGGDGTPPVGHNPLGAWSVIALLFVLGVQTLSGMFAVDVDGIESGPLSYLIEFDTGRLSSSVHGASFTALQILVVLHILAIAFYVVLRRRNLIWPMIVGTQPTTVGAVREIGRAPPWRLAAAIAVAVAAAWWIWSGARL